MPALRDGDGAAPLVWLSSADVADLLDVTACIEAVEEALRRLGGGAPPPASCGVPVPGGGFHAKAAVTDTDGRRWFAAKVNANFPGNPGRGLPTVQGLVLLADASTGEPLAVLDSAVLTARRTAAVTAIAARHLAPPGASVLTLFGCGVAGRAHLPALAAVMPRLRRVWLVDTDPAARAAAMARAEALGLQAAAADEPAAAARGSDVVVTCTPSEEFLLRAGDVSPGAFVAGVGADAPHKRELHPDLLAAATLVVDGRDACARGGDLRHALEAGAVAAGRPLAELAEVVAGTAAGRTAGDEIVVFDSTGSAVADVAAAAKTYARALEAGRGMVLERRTAPPGAVAFVAD